MELTFYNNSKMQIFINIKGIPYKIMPEGTVTIDNLEQSVDVKLITAKNSYIQKNLNKIIGYHFNVESEYNIITNNKSETITLQVIGIDGDHYEYYLRVVPTTNNAIINLKKYSIPDIMTIKKDVLTDYNAKQERNNKLQKNSKKNNMIINVILDILYSALPIIFFVYIFAHNHVQKSTMVIIMAVILVFVVIISELSRQFYDKVLKKHVNKMLSVEPEKEKFDINNIFDENHIKFIVNDKQRYQNKK